jgi:dipeptidyl aminopeptidase/acylaminoacyl peptidase
MSCAIPTGWGSVAKIAGVMPGDGVAIWGMGGIGQNILRAAKLRQANPLIAIDVEEARRSHAMELGATHFINSSKEDPVPIVQELTGGGADFCFDATGQPGAYEQMIWCLSMAGKIIAIGIMGQNEVAKLPLTFFSLQQKSMLGGLYGSVSVQDDIPKLIDVLATGEMKMVAENPGKVDRWITDHAGVIRAATQTDGVNTSLLTRPDEKTPFKMVLTTNFREALNPQFYTFDNKNLYATSNIGRDKAAVVTIDPSNGKELEKLYENPDVDVAALAYSKKRKVVTFAAFDTWKTERKFFDKQSETMYKTLAEKLPGYEVEVVANDKAEDKFIVMASNDRTPGSRNLFDTKTWTLTKLVDVAPWLKESELAPMKPVEYKSRDGLTIHGYLTLPLGREAKNLPVVINPHGGPWYRDTWGFNPEVQFLANRGYAVLQMNFRGSTGYGRKFWEASFKQWGQAMQNDITDGVQWLIKQGIADPKRVAIYGGSYGGYATLAGVAFTPDLYAAAVDYVGVANMFTFMKTIPPYWKPFLDMFHEMVGDPEKDKAMMEAVSPVMHADKIKTPLFVAQGAHDPRVNKDESDQMVAALKKRGVEVEYMVKDNEGHGFHNEENRFDFYGAMEKFLAKYLKPAA